MTGYRLLKIDELTRPFHAYLSEADNCYYLLEYTSKQGFTYSIENSMINNLKKPISTKGTSQWSYKLKEIEKIGKMFSIILKQQELERFIWIPIPPSKHKTDPEYDDRMLQVLLAMGSGYNIDIRELITTKLSTVPAHLSDNRPSVEDVKRNLDLDESQLRDNPLKPIVLFDDVITNGAHFKACQQLILACRPDAHIIGMFVARRVLREDVE